MGLDRVYKAHTEVTHRSSKGMGASVESDAPDLPQ